MSARRGAPRGAVVSVRTFPRPYALRFASGNAYPLTRADADRLLAEYPVVSASRDAVVLRGDDGTLSRLTAATLGGGPAFEVTRAR